MKMIRAAVFKSLLCGLVLAGFLSLTGLRPASAAPQAEVISSHPIPVLAYYYIWFDPSSWNRAKTDYPQLGRYSSDDPAVMRAHIRWAKAAGIQGFIVSWKSTETLNHRMDLLVDLAEEENFKLVIIYQGLDFERKPLPVERIDTDLAFFTMQYAGRKPFALFEKPMVIWSGTWEFSPEEIAYVGANHREALLLLASERNLSGVKRLTGMVDGNAYYWSSVNPDTYPDYPGKLKAMSELVHENGGLWIAPAAPGFDARLIGGTTVVERKNGNTLRTQINAALASSPDALGIISWNEFSENSHIEPSQANGMVSLNTLSSIYNLPAPAIADFDSSEISAAYVSQQPESASLAAQPSSRVEEFLAALSSSRTVAFGVIATLALSALMVIARRTRE